MLKGQALLNEVAIRTAQGMTKSELCRACGYEIDGKLKFTDFYTELMIAKGMNIPEPIECDDDDNQTIADQLLETYSSEAVSAFIELFGEECLEDFEESYQGEMSGPAACLLLPDAVLPRVRVRNPWAICVCVSYVCGWAVRCPLL